MKIENFQLKEVIGKSALSWRFIATVEVTTKKSFFKNITKTREVQKEYGSHWFFSDTGEFTPMFLLENLQREFEAKAKCGIENFKDWKE